MGCKTQKRILIDNPKWNNIDSILNGLNISKSGRFFGSEFEVSSSIVKIVVDGTLVNVFVGVDNHNEGICIEFLNGGAEFVLYCDSLNVGAKFNAREFELFDDIRYSLVFEHASILLIIISDNKECLFLE